MPHYNLRPRQSLDHLLTAHDDSEMDTLPAKTAHATNRISSVESVPPGIASSGTPPSLLPHDDHQTVPVHYRLYKRRFFGLFQLVLLNIIVSWDVSFIRQKSVCPTLYTQSLTIPPVVDILCRFKDCLRLFSCI